MNWELETRNIFLVIMVWPVSVKFLLEWEDTFTSRQHLFIGENVAVLTVSRSAGRAAGNYSITAL